ncbi:hypothetical protein GWK91_06785 [Virgibacillus sp. MSP4-1]|uniref:hypothetical protein n=1 Tax=Virgibacillus sp. MSP4-1 TaxID=2700081 RepID=UPI00039FAB83|nr:hypothetical protein [Virgibacillus sp. MSP4-1]QHS22668.1 hypothetical protein GWK91_06785 [Virgibacillus sp. MSP4-1]
MNKVLYITGTVLLLAAILVGFTTSGNEQPSQTGDHQMETEDTKAVGVVNEEEGNLVTHLDAVLTSVDELKKVIEETPDELRAINEKGEVIEKNWDEIEKQVEEMDSDAYANIERSLYPLMAEAQKENPDIEKMKSLSEKVTEKIEDFKQQISHQ